MFGKQKTVSKDFPGSILAEVAPDLYKENKGMVAILPEPLESYDNDFIVPLTLNASEKFQQHISTTQPRRVENNVCFLVNLDALKDPRDILCDDLGAWDQTRTTKKQYLVTRSTSGEAMTVAVSKEKTLVRCMKWFVGHL